MSQNWTYVSIQHTTPFIATASIAGANFGSGGPQCCSPLAQDLRLIRTRTEKMVG